VLVLLWYHLCYLCWQEKQWSGERLRWAGTVCISLVFGVLTQGCRPSTHIIKRAADCCLCSSMPTNWLFAKTKNIFRFEQALTVAGVSINLAISLYFTLFHANKG
jgi:hypothetical protein